MAYNNNNQGHVQFSSWGRTRQPKNLAGSHGSGYVTPADAGNVVANLAALRAGAKADRAARGYATENQRFLHITCEASASVANVFVYSHATDTWTELKIGGAVVAVAQNESKVFEIAGIDRVAFKGISDADKKVFFCGSTF